MKRRHPLADPVPGRAIELKLEQFAPSPEPYATAISPGVRTDLDRYDIAVVLSAIYEWRGYRYTNASDAIAAAKRTAR